MGEEVPVRATAQFTPDQEGLDRIVTVPNAITSVRLACVPLFLWMLFGAHEQTGSALLLAGLGATDWVDGFLARRWKQVSTLGKVLDPTADRILVGTAVISVALHKAVPLWFAGATLGRELLVSLAVLGLAALGSKRIDVLFVGKAGTFALMTAYPLFLISDGSHSWQHALRLLAWGFALPGIVLAWIAALSYIKPARQALADGRERTTPTGSDAGAGPVAITAVNTVAASDVGPGTTTETEVGALQEIASVKRLGLDQGGR